MSSIEKFDQFKCTILNPTKNIDWALWYAQRGFRVHPLKPNSKEPAFFGWQNSSTTNPEPIQEWWTDNPDYNIGLLPGNVIVVDVDVKNGKEGEASLLQLSQGHHTETFKVNSPSGGYHLYYSAPEGKEFKDRNGLANGIDIKTGASNLVGAGSTYNQSPYTAADISQTISAAPDWLIQALEKNKQEAPDNQTSLHKQLPNPVDLFTDVPDEEIYFHLNRIDPDLDYDSWLLVLYACLNTWGCQSWVIDALSEWSSRSYKYDKREFNKKIETRDPSYHKQPGTKTLVDIAYVHPKLRAAALPYIEKGEEPVPQLIELTYSYAIQVCESNGNELSGPHKAALHCLSKYLVLGVFSKEPFRIACPLPTGTGKTTCIIGLMMAIHELKLADISLLIAAERIKELEEIKQSAINHGVPEEKLGVFHSSHTRHPEIKSIDEEQLDSTQFLLVAHNRVKNTYGKNKPITYKGQKRHLVIWDESLITTSHQYFDIKKIRSDAASWKASYQQKLEDDIISSDTHQINTLDQHLDMIITNITDTENNNLCPLPKPPLTNREIKEAIDAIESHENLEEFLCIDASNTFYKIKTRQGSILISYRAAVQDEFDQIIILDACAGIKTLMSLDESITTADISANINYSNVTISHSDVKSSKHFLSGKANRELTLDEIEHLLRHVIPQGEQVLVFTYIDFNGISFRTELENRLRAMGGEYIDRVKTLTWGSHKATNKVSNVKYIITFGVQYRNEQELAASIISQTRNTNYPIKKCEIKNIQDAEQGSMLYQAVGRGFCRYITDGKAGETHFFLFHPDNDVIDILKRLMPGVIIETYIPKYLKPKERKNSCGDAEGLTLRILDFMSSYQGGRITTNRLRRLVCLEVDSGDRLWRNAKDEATKQLPDWKLERQTFIRILPSDSGKVD